MVKVLLGAVTGTGLYLYSNSPSGGGNKVGFYLIGMAALALTAVWALRAARIGAGAHLRTAIYILRSRRIAMDLDRDAASNWAPLVESTKAVTVDGGRTDEIAVAVSV